MVPATLLGDVFISLGAQRSTSASHRELTYKIGVTGGDVDIRFGTTLVSPIASAIGKTRLASKGRKLAWIDDNGPPIGSRALEIVPHGLNTERL